MLDGIIWDPSGYADPSPKYFIPVIFLRFQKHFWFITYELQRNVLHHRKLLRMLSAKCTFSCVLIEL